MTDGARALTWAIAAMVAASAARAGDEWEPDDTVATDNVLFHGSEQRHTLVGNNPVDQDLFLVSPRPYSSYQAVVHGLTGDLDLTASDVQLMDATGLGALQNALVTGGGGILSLQWHEANIPSSALLFLRVRDAACGTECDDRRSYRIVFYDTTYTVPRVNNSGTQTSVLLIQNATERPCDVAQHYFDAAGAHIASGPLLVLGGHRLAVVSTAEVFPGQSGSVRVTHTCGYGGLAGKAVSVEAATGFTFDTPFAHRPH
jgi:hypothetical protein